MRGGVTLHEQEAFFISSLTEPAADVQLLPVAFADRQHHDDPRRRNAAEDETAYDGDWMSTDKRRTSRGVLALSLNVGVDPPDVVKRDPCAHLECWLNPFDADPEKSVANIGEALLHQYEVWQPRAKYIPLGDPQPVALEEECKRARRAAGGDRVLFHYNGHGVPTATATGEIWVFNEDFTQYLPVSMYELMHWLGEPTIFVFDCNGAGHLIEWYRAALEESSRSAGQPLPSAVELVSMSVMFGACQRNETLPSNPDLPADVLTACLTTPIRMALTWHIHRRSLLTNAPAKKLSELVDSLPGKLDNRRTPLGELNWIFTAVTDAIAYTTCSPALFQKLFREDTLLASLCRNFLLAERMMRSSHITPVSFPALPATSQHQMWMAWDLEVERCLAALLQMARVPDAPWPVSTFFEDQLKALDIWTASGQQNKPSPASLSCLLQALLSQTMRERALWCLARYMDLGSWAVERALALGVFLYLLKLLKSGSRNLRAPLLIVWGKVVALEPKVVPELCVPDHIDFFLHAMASNSSDELQRVMAAFILATCCAQSDNARRMCAEGDFFGLIAAFCSDASAHLRTWCALSAAHMWRGDAQLLSVALRCGCTAAVAALRNDNDPRVRAAAVFAIGTMAKGPLVALTDVASEGRFEPRTMQLPYLIEASLDGCPSVRREAMIAIAAQMGSDPIAYRRVALASYQAEVDPSAPLLLAELDRPLAAVWDAAQRATLHEPDPCALSVAQLATSTVASTLTGIIRAMAPPTVARTAVGSVARTVGGSANPASQGGGGDVDATPSAGSSSTKRTPRWFGTSGKSKAPSPPPSPLFGSASTLGGAAVSVSAASASASASSVTKLDVSRKQQQGSPRSPRDAQRKPGSPRDTSRDEKKQHRSMHVSDPDIASIAPPKKVSARSVTSIDALQPYVPTVESERMREPLLNVAVDKSHPDYIVRANLQERHRAATRDSLARIARQQRSAGGGAGGSTTPFDRERARIKSGAGAASTVTAVAFAPGPPQLLGVATGATLTEWRFDDESSNSADAMVDLWPLDLSLDSGSSDALLGGSNSEVEQLLARGAVSRTPVRRWTVPVSVCSINALNGHSFPLWATGSVDGSVRIWGRGLVDDGAPLVSSFLVDTKCSLQSPLMTAWDATTMKLQASGGRTPVVQTWDVESERVSHSLALPGEGTALAMAPGALSVAGTSSGQMVLFDWRVGPLPVRVWQEHGSGAGASILGVGITAGSADAPLAWTQVIGASRDGRCLMWDLRAPAHSVRSMAFGAMRAFAVHALRGHFACSSASDGGVSVYNYGASLVSNVKYFDVMPGVAVPAVERLAFHPFASELACGLATGETLVLAE